MENSKTRILVADDEEPILNVCESFLSRNGYDVSLAENGHEAIQSLIQNDYDLVLTDYNMPDINGMELVQRIRQSKPHIGVIMMTGYGTIELAVTAMKNGADDFVMKPFNFEQVSLTLERVKKNKEVSEEVRKLRVINRKQEELEKIKNKFIDITSHEIKTPVTNIITFSEIIGDSLSQDQQEFFDIINNSAKRLRRIAEDMHSSLFNSDLKSHLCIDSFKISELVAGLLCEFDNVADDRSLKLQSTFSDNVEEWKGDTFLLQRALREILRNAIKYTPDGGTIQIDCQILKNDLNIKIIDTGIGISEDDQFRIFDTFYEAQDTQHHSTSETAFMGSGTGLGLCVAKSIIEAHNGKISVHSQIDKGSTFTVKLPK